MDWRELRLDNSNDLKSEKLRLPISNWRRFGQLVIRQMPSSRSSSPILKHFSHFSNHQSQIHEHAENIDFQSQFVSVEQEEKRNEVF